MSLQEKQLLDALLDGYNKKDSRLIRAAYDSAAKAHVDQTRDGGAPYVTHPLAVALKVKEFGLDVPSIIVALLHDVAEDTKYSIEDISERYGNEVATMVDGLTKTDTVHYQPGDVVHKAETYRKIILATAKDLRVVIIKLLDRWHNMTTVDVFSEQRRKKYAEETLRIYAPIAHRLGIAQLKEELEDMALAALDPQGYEEAKLIIDQKVKESGGVLTQLQEKLEVELKQVGIKNFEIYSREKSRYSLHEKLKTGRNPADIYDILGLRIITRKEADCYLALGKVHALWKPIPGRFADFIANPKPNMYQSLHTSVTDEIGNVFEVQIRTQEMHEIANYGLASHWHYKETHREKVAVIDDWLQKVAQEQELITDPNEIIDAIVADTFQNEIYVFTPKGAARVLPEGATPVDFAYAIHSEVGNKCVGAKANNRIVPLSQELHSGDIVEIITSKSQNAKPSADWLRSVTTTKAKTHIRKATQKEARIIDVQRGEELLKEALKKQHMPLKLMNEESLASSLQVLHVENTEELYYKLGTSKLVAKQVARCLLKENLVEEETEALVLQRQRPRKEARGGVVLTGEGLESVEVSYARCCNPLPGDKIKGYVSMGRGVIVHRADCANIKVAPTIRRTGVAWSEDAATKNSFLAELRIRAWDRPRLLEDFTHLLAERGVNLHKVTMNTNEQVVTGSLLVEVTDVNKLQGTIGELRSLEGVFSVERS